MWPYQIPLCRCCAEASSLPWMLWVMARGMMPCPEVKCSCLRHVKDMLGLKGLWVFSGHQLRNGSQSWQCSSPPPPAFLQARVTWPPTFSAKHSRGAGLPLEIFAPGPPWRLSMALSSPLGSEGLEACRSTAVHVQDCYHSWFQQAILGWVLARVMSSLDFLAHQWWAVTACGALGPPCCLLHCCGEMGGKQLPRGTAGS